MTIIDEIEKIRAIIREVEDPAAAMALRHVCNALEGLEKERREKERFKEN